MGNDKALIEVGARSMVEHVCTVLDAAGLRPLSCSSAAISRRLTAATRREVLADTWPGEVARRGHRCRALVRRSVSARSSSPRATCPT